MYIYAYMCVHIYVYIYIYIYIHVYGIAYIQLSPGVAKGKREGITAPEMMLLP